METFVLTLHVLIAIAMTGFILLQQGKGAEMGASFGAGSSQTVFGSAGSAGFLTKATAVLALVFFVTSISLAIFARKQVDSVAVPFVPVPAEKAPAVPANADVPAAAASQPVAPAPAPVAEAPAAAAPAPVAAAPAVPAPAPVVKAVPAPAAKKPAPVAAEAPVSEPKPVVEAAPAAPTAETPAESAAGTSNP